MARKATKAPVNAQMYRHFAAVTVAATLALAMFAHGEAPEAAARDVAVMAEQSPGPNVDATGFVRRDAPSSGAASAGGGFDGEFGQPMDTLGATAQDGILPGEFASGSVSGVPEGYNVYGVSAAVWAGLTEEQRLSIAKSYKKERAAAARPERSQQIESLMAASLARSSGDNDLGIAE